jgi:hypothetical protein
MAEITFTTKGGVEVTTDHYPAGMVWLCIHDAQDLDAGSVRLSVEEANLLVDNLCKSIADVLGGQHATPDL